MTTPPPFEADPCIPADLAPADPDELTTLHQQRAEIHNLLTAATHQGAVNIIQNLQRWQRNVLYSLPPNSGITRDPDSLRGKTLTVEIPQHTSKRDFKTL